jgi:hypothetical protein
MSYVTDEELLDELETANARLLVRLEFERKLPVSPYVPGGQRPLIVVPTPDEELPRHV